MADGGVMIVEVSKTGKGEREREKGSDTYAAKANGIGTQPRDTLSGYNGAHQLPYFHECFYLFIWLFDFMLNIYKSRFSQSLESSLSLTMHHKAMCCDLVQR